MKTRLTILALAFLCIAGSAVHAQQQPDMEAMMKAWQAAMTPGDAHKKLDFFVGSWETATKMWMDPSAPPQESKGTAVFSWELGNRQMKQEYKGEMMGMPFVGIGYTGYDNIRKKYTMLWIDNMSTAVAVGDGFFDRAGKVLTFFSKMDEPTTGEHDKTVKYIIRFGDEKHFTFEIHDLAIGEPNTKVMEMSYKKK